MPDLFLDFTPEEIAMFGRAELEASKKKMPEHFKPTDKMSEGYQYLSGEIEDTSSLHYKTYCNELYDAWKAWAPKFCSRPPDFRVRPGNTANQPLAQTCQELFRYRTQRFDYQQMILQVCQDAIILGIGYFRHHWDSARGLTVTQRFRPQNVFWDATAKSISGAKHVIEKHSLPRWQFAKKFGAEVAKDIPAADCDDDGGYWPAESKFLTPDGKSPLDPITYYLLWSIHGDCRRCYAFHESWHDDYLQPANRKANKCKGEKWAFDFDDGEWHLTPMIPTVLNDRIEGIAAWEVVRGQYLAYQNVMGAIVKFALQTCKKVILHPDTMSAEVRKIEASGDTMFSVKYPKEVMEDYPGRKITDLIEVLEFGNVSADLLNLMNTLQARFQQLIGNVALAQSQPGNVETAAEATKLADAASNRVADDQGAVERSVNKVARKELTSDLAMIPNQSVGEWTLEEADEDEETSEEGYADDYDEDEKEGVQYVKGIPYDEAILLEKGPASDKAALRMEAAREKARNNAWVQSTMGMLQGMQPDQVADQVPVTPEVAVRRKWGVPVLADFKITNPGIEQFVSEGAAQFWPQRPMSRREVERMFQVGIEQGTSTSTGRMQRVQEVGMVAKMNMPVYQELGLSKQQASILNAVLRVAENDNLDDAIVTPEEIEQAKQAMQQAAQQQAMAEAQAKQPAGENPEVVKMQSDAEMAKAQASVIASKEKTSQIDKKNEGDAMRDRSKNIMMMNQAALNGAMNGAT